MRRARCGSGPDPSAPPLARTEWLKKNVTFGLGQAWPETTTTQRKLSCHPGQARVVAFAVRRRAHSRARAGTQSQTRQPPDMRPWVPGLVALARDDKAGA